MTPAEVIALSGCSRPEDGRPCKICAGRAEKHVRAVEAGGMAVVSAEDLRTYLDKSTADYKTAWDASTRLRAALPERRSS